MNCIMCGPSHMGFRHAGCTLKHAFLLMAEDFISQSCRRDLSTMLKFTFGERNWQRRHYSTWSQCLLSSVLIGMIPERGTSGAL